MDHNKGLWTCPECKHQFVNPNTWHSCGNYELEEHFNGKEKIVREIFDRLVEIVEQFGPVTVYAQKTRIVFQVRTRFASAVTRKRWLIAQVWLRRQADHPTLQRVEMYTYRDYGNIYRLKSLEDIDEAFKAILFEAYVMGDQ